MKSRHSNRSRHFRKLTASKNRLADRSGKSSFFYSDSLPILIVITGNTLVSKSCMHSFVVRSYYNEKLPLYTDYHIITLTYCDGTWQGLRGGWGQVRALYVTGPININFTSLRNQNNGRKMMVQSGN